MPLRSGPPARLAIPAGNSTAGTRGRAFLQHGDSGGAASSGQANVPSTARVHTKRAPVWTPYKVLEAKPGFEPGVKALQASALPLGHVAIPWRLSLQRPVKQEPDRPSDDNGADNGIRTRDPHLGKVMLYQLSHVRIARRYYKGSSQTMQALISRNSRLVRKRPPGAFFRSRAAS